MNKLSIFIVGVFALLLSACSQPVDKISQEVNQKYAKALKEVEVDSFYIKTNFKMDEMGVCGSDFNILGHCASIADFYVTENDDTAYLIDGTYGELTENGWVVYVPDRAKRIKINTVKNVVKRALSELVFEKKKRLEIEKSWEE